MFMGRGTLLLLDLSKMIILTTGSTGIGSKRKHINKQSSDFSKNGILKTIAMFDRRKKNTHNISLDKYRPEKIKLIIH